MSFPGLREEQVGQDEKKPLGLSQGFVCITVASVCAHLILRKKQIFTIESNGENIITECL